MNDMQDIAKRSYSAFDVHKTTMLSCGRRSCL